MRGLQTARAAAPGDPAEKLSEPSLEVAEGWLHLLSVDNGDMKAERSCTGEISCPAADRTAS